MNHLLASIIVPIFNAERFLPELLSALRAQSFSDFEVILVDDGSTDNSAKLCREVENADSRFHLHQQKNAGVSVARNAGMDLAQGDYLLFCDADDLPDENWVESLVECGRNNRADMAIGGFIKEIGGKKQQIPPPKLVTPPDATAIRMNLVMPMCVWGYAPKHSAGASFYGSSWRSTYSRCFASEHAIRFPVGVPLGEDLLFNLQFFLLSPRIAFSPECHYLYRDNPVSATHQNASLRWERYLDLWRRVHQMLVAAELPDEELRWHNYQLTRYLISTLVETICPSGKLWGEQLSLLKALLQESELQQVLHELPESLDWRQKWLTQLMRPNWSSFLLAYYRRRMS